MNNLSVSAPALVEKIYEAVREELRKAGYDGEVYVIHADAMTATFKVDWLPVVMLDE